MLQRPPRTTTARRRERTRRSEATRRWRRRARNGRAVYLVEVDGAVIDFLVRMRWLLEEDARDRCKVVARLLADAAQG